MTSQDKADVFRSLSKMLEAGVLVSRSMEVLLEQKPTPGVREWLTGVHAGLAQHHGLSESVARQTRSSELEKSLIQAGERSGTLPQIMSELSGYYGMLATLEKKTRSGLAYPVGLLHLGLILPEIQRFFGDESAAFVCGSLALKLCLLWAVLAGAWKGFHWLEIRSAADPGAERLFSWVPFYGKARAHFAFARFAKVVEIGLLAGLGMPEIFRLAGKAAQSARIRSAAEGIAQSAAQGEALAVSFAATAVFTPAFRQAVVTAEISGTLDTEMKHLAVLENEAARAAYEQAAVWTPKFLIGAATALVAFRVIRGIVDYYAQIQALL